MSQIGERIGRRLMRRHGFKFRFDPCNFRVKSDPEGVSRNVHGGQGVMQWILWIDYEAVTITFRGRDREAEIGSDHGASTVLTWPHWHVYFDADMTGPECSADWWHPIFWIDNGHGRDITEL
jgi:hypothetical protein